MATSNYQKIILEGNLGGDAEKRFTPSGSMVTNFSVAVNTYKTTNGNEEKETHWFRCALWGEKIGNAIAPYLTKGKRVLVEGRLNPRLWTDSNGEKRLSLDVTVSDFRLLGGNGQTEAEGHGEEPQDEIPF